MSKEKFDYILFSPSKEMRQGSPTKKELDLPTKDLLPQSKEILQVLRSLNLDELHELYGISLDKVLLEKKRIDELGLSPAVPAYKLYHGAAYKELNKNKLTKSEESFLGKHLVILSAFYGPLLGRERIWPYRLDFMMGFNLGEKSLRKLWKEEIQRFFKDKRILNLASTEFSSLLSKKTANVVDVDFVADKKISTYEKKQLRGKLAGEVIKHKCLEIGKLLDIMEGWKGQNESNNIIFKKNA